MYFKLTINPYKRLLQITEQEGIDRNKITQHYRDKNVEILTCSCPDILINGKRVTFYTRGDHPPRDERVMRYINDWVLHQILTGLSKIDAKVDIIFTTGLSLPDL